MSNKHTTSFTTDPEFRARQRVRQALETLRDEAKVSGNAFQSVGDRRETEYWRHVGRISTELLTQCQDPEPRPLVTLSPFNNRPVVPTVGHEFESETERDC